MGFPILFTTILSPHLARCYLFLLIQSPQLHSLNVLSFSTYNFHLLRSWMQLVQFFIFSFFMPFLMSSYPLFFGLPNGRVNIGFHLYTFCYHSLFRHSMQMATPAQYAKGFTADFFWSNKPRPIAAISCFTKSKVILQWLSLLRWSCSGWAF